MNQRNISWSELAQISEYAKNKFSYIGDDNERDLAVLDFCGRYIDGGRFVVYNNRNQFLADFDALDQYTTKKKTSLKTNYLVLNVKF